MRGPGYILLDANLKKDLKFGETQSLSIRVDSSNVLDYCNYLNVNTGWSNACTLGVVALQNGYPRRFQIWLTYKFQAAEGAQPKFLVTA